METTNQVKQNVSTGQQGCLKTNTEAQSRLTSLLVDCYQTLNVFGKEPESIQAMKRIFVLALADYDILQIEGAFVEYIRQSSVMPTPADIVQILEKNLKKKRTSNWDEWVNAGKE